MLLGDFKYDDEFQDARNWERIWSKSNIDCLVYCHIPTNILAVSFDGNKSNPGSYSTINSLEEDGILLFKNPETQRDHSASRFLRSNAVIELSGGSVCVVHLDLRTKTIYKTPIKSILSSEDTSSRHVGEFRYLSGIPTSMASLFPSRSTVYSNINDEDTILSNEFHRGYTLGEKVHRGELTIELVWQILDEMISNLEKTVWTAKEPSLQRRYTDLIRRRFRQFSEPSIFSRLYRESFSINGIAFPSIEKVMEKVELHVADFNNLFGAGCHGDLILEDIVVAREDKNKYRIKLVDPNPQNTSWLIDYSKLMMSVLLHYEQIYFDRYMVKKFDDLGSEIEIQYALEPHVSSEVLQSLETHFQFRFERSCATLKQTEISFEKVKIHACLNMLALPAFHDIQHGNSDRSLVFVAHAMMALKQYGVLS